METSLKTGFAQIFSRRPKNLSCPKFRGAAAPLAPPARTPMLVWIAEVALTFFSSVYNFKISLYATGFKDFSSLCEPWCYRRIPRQYV